MTKKALHERMNRSDFKCRCCGACCRIKDGIVRISDAEIARIASFLGMLEEDFIDRETEVAPDRRGLILKSRHDGACVWLSDDNHCRINPVKPDKCRSFPREWTNPDSNAVCPELAGEDKRGVDLQMKTPCATCADEQTLVEYAQ